MQSRPIAKFTNLSAPLGLSLDVHAGEHGGAWHIWRNTQGSIICNGPEMSNRHLEFANIDDAITWLFHWAPKEVARALHAANKEIS